MSLTPELRAFIVGVVEERVSELKVTREEFEKLKTAVEKNTEAIEKLSFAVNKLAEAQKKTEERINELAEAQKKTEERINELAEAQKKTEERINELAEAQKKTEERINELAEAQKKTEERINELAEAQKKTEERINELAEAQKKTEENVSALAKRIESLAVEVGKLSEAVGFSLEDLGRELLPSRLREMGIDVMALERRYFVVDGEEVEVNLCGEGVWNGRKVLVVGEVKSRIYSNDVGKFNAQAEKIVRHTGREIFKLMFGFAVHPSAIIEAESQNISLFTAYRPSRV
ncbi:hypothetical protein KEJ13_03935 [Candidatus Bathyarchaeota archaeon]|nr:hypothetical protein [Candidatus Bathyarchaeota archaeon]